MFMNILLNLVDKDKGTLRFIEREVIFWGVSNRGISKDRLIYFRYILDGAIEAA